MCRQLVWHRQKFIDSYNFPQANHTHSSSAPTRSPPKSPVSPKKRSPLPKRHAPPPPNSMIRQRTSTGAMEKRANFSKSSRYSLQVDAVEMMSKEQFNMITNPQLVGDHSGHSKQGHHYSGRPDERQFYSLQRRHSRGSGHSSNRSSSPQHHHISPPILTEGRDVTRPQTHNSPAKSNRRGSSSHTQPLATGSPSLIGQSQQTDYLGSKSSLPTQTSPSITSITGSPSLTGQSKQTNYLKSKSSLPTQTSPSVTGITGPSKGVGNHPQHVAASPAAMPALPTTYFSSRDASDLMEQVRKQSGVSHRKAQIAASVVLQFLKERVPQCEGLVDGMFAALEQAQVRPRIIYGCSSIPDHFGLIRGVVSFERGRGGHGVNNKIYWTYQVSFISGGWNRGVPLYTEMSSFQGVGIEEFHCIQRCPHFRVLE